MWIYILCSKCLTPISSLKMYRTDTTRSYNTQSVSVQIWRSCILQCLVQMQLIAIILSLYQSKYDALVSFDVSYRCNSVLNSGFLNGTLVSISIINPDTTVFSCICLTRYISIPNTRFLNNLYLSFKLQLELTLRSHTWDKGSFSTYYIFFILNSLT